ncbi:MAG: GNAT family N-acetyltransferase [Bacteroidetes bacterium]|nr:GNAT family N-acetyltransferase [Bacteroidota bacterium]
MENNCTIRAYENNDLPQVLHLIELNTPAYFAPEEIDDFKKYLATERELYYIILIDHKIVGCGGINFDNEYLSAKISWDIIHPDYHGKSFGKKLLNFRIEKLITMKSIKEITVRTSQLTNHFYEKQGFELFEIIKDYWAKGYDLYNMKYSLDYKK